MYLFEIIITVHQEIIKLKSQMNSANGRAVRVDLRLFRKTLDTFILNETLLISHYSFERFTEN